MILKRWRALRSKAIENEAEALTDQLRVVAMGVAEAAVELRNSIEDLKHVTAELKTKTTEGGRP